MNQVDGGVLRRNGKGMSMTPATVIARFERGEIERDEMQAMMALFARELIREMEEDHANPVAALWERWQVRRGTANLVRRVGRRVLRDVLVALAELEDFPPAEHLWNAGHEDVPLECFFRWTRQPTFRIKEIRVREDVVDLLVEYGADPARERMRLRRNGSWQLRVEERRPTAR